jgi:hypothetical protein
LHGVPQKHAKIVLTAGSTGYRPSLLCLFRATAGLAAWRLLQCTNIKTAFMQPGMIEQSFQ